MNKKGKLTLFGAVGVAVIYCFLSGVYLLKVKAGSAEVVSKLGKLRRPLLEFFNEHQSFPDALKDIGADGYEVRDAIAGKDFLYFSKAPDGILLMQPAPFRTMLLPFGEMRQWALRTNEIIENVYLSLPKSGRGDK